MSRTIEFGPSFGAKNAASTMKVAPWRFWAGPNASPRRLWAIMMWSRTSRANMAAPVSVGEEDGERAGIGEQGGQAVGRVGQRQTVRQQRIERGIVKQR